MIWLKSLNVYALVALIGLGGVIYAGYKRHEARKIAAAVEATKATISAGALEAATKTAAAEREAIEATPLPESKAAVIALCKQRASCRERSALK
jgi:hypothetical protein